MKVMVILLLCASVMVPIALSSMAGPPARTASANCSSCHSSSYYMRVTLSSVDVPEEIALGAQAQVDVKVDVTCSHNSASYAAFDITVSLSQQSSRLVLPAPQTLTGQLPGGAKAPYAWSRTLSFTVTGKTGGSEVITATAQMDPVHRSPPVTDSGTAATTVTVTNRPPVLSQEKLDPTSGDTRTSFNYSVLYSDPDGDAPSYIRLLVDGAVMGDIAPLPGQGTDHITGVRYGMTGLKLSEGSHSYGFKASDGSVQVDHPSSGSFAGPQVVRANSPPMLSNGTVLPGSGRPNDGFTFYVDYLDMDDDPPSSGVLISISGGPYTQMSLDGSAPSSKRDGAFTNGERFMFKRALDEGTYRFSFNASDGRSHHSIGPFKGPVVSAAPTLVASIDEPKDGTVVRVGEGLYLNGSFSSNRAVTDAVLTWSSNISGTLGNGSSIRVVLPIGHHRLELSVSSAGLSLKANASVSVRVLSGAPVLTLWSVYPTGDVRMEEGSDQVFGVNASSVPPGTIGYHWELDGSSVGTGLPEWTYGPGYDAAGSHLVACTLTNEGAVPLVKTWVVLVVDIPAPIEVKGGLTGELGKYALGDLLELTIDASDPLGRSLSVRWSIDGFTLDLSTGLTLSLVLREGHWASLGDHLVAAMVRNPDGTEVEIRYTYSVQGPDPYGPEGKGPPGPLLAEATDDSSSKDQGTGLLEGDWLGYLIVVVCTLAAVMKLVNVIMVLTKKDKVGPSGGPIGGPVPSGVKEQKEGFERWD